MSTAIDLLLIAILLICGWSGYKKGLIMGIGGIVVFAVAVYGANLLSNAYSYEAIDALRPFAGGYVEKKIGEEVDAPRWASARRISPSRIIWKKTRKKRICSASQFLRPSGYIPRLPKPCRPRHRNMLIHRTSA